MEHHPFGVVATANAQRDVELFPNQDKQTNEQSTTPASSKEAANKRRNLTQEENAAKKKQKLNWGTSLALDRIMLNNTRDNVLLLVSLDWTEKIKVSQEMKLVFMKSNNIAVTAYCRNNSHLSKLVVNHIKAQGNRDKVQENLRKKKVIRHRQT